MQGLRHKIYILFLLFIPIATQLQAQNGLQAQLGDSLTVIANQYSSIGKIERVRLLVNKNEKRITVDVSPSFSYIPFRPENVEQIYAVIKSVVSKHYPNYSISCVTNKQKIEELIPNYYRKKKQDNTRNFKVKTLKEPLVNNDSRPYTIKNGLQKRHIALWKSHGWYYNQKLERWEWQRPRLFQTVEDLFTQSYVVPYLIPMLENAGAYVLIPFERDFQANEVIVDNDNNTTRSYKETNNSKKWKSAKAQGFANTKPFYLQGENPFLLGTYKEIAATNNKEDVSWAEWRPNIPETGRYAVYVSYKSVKNSTPDARYTIHHSGGTTEFSVNQTMGGGTWIYLGHFHFAKGQNDNGKVVLSNWSEHNNKIITADAVKFGGGMGNIARYKTDSTEVSIELNVAKNGRKNGYPLYIDMPSSHKAETSGYPRFTEGARYWLQWAGAPDSIYSRSKGLDDYIDDFQSRGAWVNYLLGGSGIAPTDSGLNIPVDMVLAFHTDAGYTANDSIIGTLGIFSVQNTDNNTTVYKNGVSRWAARDLTDIVQTQLVEDIRKQFAPEWTRRSMWNKSYNESRVPEVPSMILELLSHQNLADMRYGIDPRFQFAASRAVYKGILRYLSSANNFDYVVQPLPVNSFSSVFTENDSNQVILQWEATTDSLEPTAKADKFILYTRINDGDFDNGTIVKKNSISVDIENDRIYSFKITGINDGGESFPSEILSVCRLSQSKGNVLIVNGFDRLSAPVSFIADTTYGGFLNQSDAGVPYLHTSSFTGEQYEFKRDKPWIDNDAPGFGASHADKEGQLIAGNTFDYPYLHGKSIKEAGYSFTSSSRDAFTKESIDISAYQTLNVILGKQKQTLIGNQQQEPAFKTFPLELQNAITAFCGKGGNLFISGAHVASDVYEGVSSTVADVVWFESVLKTKYRTNQASRTGEVKLVASPFEKHFNSVQFNFHTLPNAISYYVESADAIEPTDANTYTIFRYSENNKSAATAYRGFYKLCLLGFPFEAIEKQSDRDILMQSVFNFFEN